ncbi:MAG TPA: TetR/AcrR family transcriptional regulator [Alphaproteobacteria bacterium]
MKAATVRSRPNPRRRSAEILAAAAQVFAERGFHGASTQDIADVLGIRQASLYYYFDSKEAALEEVCARGAEGYAEAAAAVAASTGTAADKVYRLIDAHLSPMLDRAAFVMVFQRERRYLPKDSRRRVGRFSRNYERIVESVLKAGVAAGEFRRDLDCRLCALALLGMGNAATHWFNKEPGVTVERLATEFTRLLVDGMTKAPRPPLRRVAA